MTNNPNEINARIGLDTAGFSADAAQITKTAQTTARNIGTAFSGVGGQIRGSFQGLTNSAAVQSIGQYARNSGQAFTQLNNSIQQSQLYLMGWSAAAGGLAYAGIQAADSIDMLNKRYIEIMGSQKAATETMRMIERSARNVGMPIRQTQRDFAGMVPAILQAGESIEDYLGLALRLSTVNPSEGMSGAIFAMREALTSGGTDLVSLAERFNMPRVALRQMVQETGSFSAALDYMLDKQGATQKMAEQQARSVNNLAAVIRDKLTIILEKAFVPILEHVRDALEWVSNALDNMPEGLVSAGVGVTVLGGAFSGLLLVAGQVVSAFGAVGGAINGVIGFVGKLAPGLGSIAKIMGGMAAKGGLWASVLGGAAALGGNIGLKIGNWIGEQIGNDFAANADWEDIANVAKKSLFLLVNALIEGIRPIGPVLAFVISIFQNFGDAIKLYVGQLKAGFGALLIILAEAIKWIGDWIGQGDQWSGDLRGAGETMFLDGEREKLEALSSMASSYTDNLESFNSTLDGIVIRMHNWASAADEAAEATRSSSEVVLSWAAEMRVAMAVLSEAKLKQRGDELAAAADDLMARHQQLAEFEEAASDQISDRIVALRREQEAAKNVADQLREFTDVSTDAKEKFEELSDRIVAIGDEIPELTAVLADAVERDLKEAGDTLAEETKKAEDKRTEALKKAEEKRDDDLAKLLKSNEKSAGNIRKKMEEANRKADEKQLKAAEDHRKKLAEIERKYDLDAQQAAASLDAAALQELTIRRGEDVRKAEESFSETTAASTKEREEKLANIQQEHADLMEAFEERRAEILAQYEDEKATAQRAHDEQLGIAIEAYEKERQALLNTHQQRLADIEAAGQTELFIRQQINDEVKKAAEELLNTLRQRGPQMTTAGMQDETRIYTPLSYGRGLGNMLSNSQGATMSMSNMTTNVSNSPLNASINVNGATSPTEVANAVYNILGRMVPR